MARTIQDHQHRVQSSHYIVLPPVTRPTQMIAVPQRPRRPRWLAPLVGSFGLLCCAVVVLSAAVVGSHFQSPTEAQASPAAAAPRYSALVAPQRPRAAVATTAGLVAVDADALRPKGVNQPVSVAVPKVAKPHPVGVVRPNPQPTQPADPTTTSTTTTPAPDPSTSTIAKLLAAAAREKALKDRTPETVTSLPTRLSKSAMLRGLAGLSSGARTCFRNRGVDRARVPIRIKIQGATGRVLSVTVAGRWGNSIPGRCVVRKAKGLRFSRFSNATHVVSYTLSVR